MRTANAQISLRVRAISLGPSLPANRIIGYYRASVCLEVLRPNQPNGAMSSAVSLPNHILTGQAKSSKRLTSNVHILKPETDNCPS